MSVKLGQNNFESNVLKEEKAILVDFYSDSCVPCKRLSPILAELEEIYADEIVVGKVNTVFEQELASEYEIMSLPTVLFFKQGKVKGRLIGRIEREDLVQEIEKNITERGMKR